MGPPRHWQATALAALSVFFTEGAMARDWAFDYGAGFSRAAAATPEGGFVVAGDHWSGDPTAGGDALLLKLDPDGLVSWAVALGGPLFQGFSGVAVTPTGYIAFGELELDPFGYELLGAGYDFDGNLLWQYTFAECYGSADHPVVASSDGAYFVSFMTPPSPDRLDSVLKVTADGSVLWHRGVDQADVFGSRGGRLEIVASDAGRAVLAKTDWRQSRGTWLPQLVELESDGTVRWMREFGAAPDTYTINGLHRLADGSLLVGGEVSQAFNGDAWMLLTDAAGNARWQVRHGTELEPDYGGEAVPLPGGDILMTWGRWDGPPGSQYWSRFDSLGTILASHETIGSVGWHVVQLTDGLLATGARLGQVAVTRLDASGLTIAECVTTTPIVPFSGPPPTGQRDVILANESLAIEPSPTAFVPRGLLLTPTCSGSTCPMLTCDWLQVSPPDPCPGDEVTLELLWSGGEGEVRVAWDLDGDGATDDALGNPVLATAPQGSWSIAAEVTDSCADGTQSCLLSDVVLVPGPLGQVSDVLAGAPPLRLRPPNELVFAAEANAVAYHLNVGNIGTWYDSTAVTGERCAIVSWTDLGDGTLLVSDALPAGASSWIVVTAANHCFEGGAGASSTGAARDGQATWTACGPLP